MYMWCRFRPSTELRRGRWMFCGSDLTVHPFLCSRSNLSSRPPSSSIGRTWQWTVGRNSHPHDFIKPPPPPTLNSFTRCTHILLAPLYSFPPPACVSRDDHPFPISQFKHFHYYYHRRRGTKRRTEHDT